MCPQCGSIRVRQRKRTSDWVCQAGQGGAPHERHADFTFAEPRFELQTDHLAIRRLNAVDRGKYDGRWNDWLRSPEYTENRLLALRLYILESKRYLSMEDTKTLCRPCAAREDYERIRRSERRAARKQADHLQREFDSLEWLSEGGDAEEA